MKKKYKVVSVAATTQPKKTTTKFLKDEIVNFIGHKYFTTPTGKIYYSVKPGVAKIDAIMKNDAKHPYHIIVEKKGEIVFQGWVSEEDLEKRPEVDKKENKTISFANSKKVKISFAKNTNKGIQIVAEDWQDNNWTAVFRLRDPQDADKLAHMAEIGCVKKEFNEVVAYTNTFIEICIDAAKIPMIDTVNERNLINSGLFYHLTGEDFLQKTDYLRRGDILLSNAGSAIVLSNGVKSSELPVIKVPKTLVKEVEEQENFSILSKDEIEPKVVTAQKAPEEKDYDLTGAYLAITPATIRTRAGIDSPILTKIPKGSTVRNYGFYTTVDKVKWYYIQTKYKNTIYNGFVSEKCFIKK